MRTPANPTQLRSGDDVRRMFSDLSPIKVGAVRLGAGGPVLDAEGRRALLMAAAAGDPLPVELEFDATTYHQGSTPNRNAVRFRKGTLRAVAKTFAGVPFLLNHDWENQAARMGTVTKSAAARAEDGTVSFEMSVRVVKQHAIMSVLDGTIDRFSIGFVPTGPIVCSCHGVEFFSEAWADKCGLWPGDLDSKGRIVEAEFTAAEGVELSSVNVPAVIGTGIDTIRTKLSLMFDRQPPTQERTTNMLITVEMKKAVGLAADATDQDYLTHVGRLAASAQAAEQRAATAEANARQAADAVARANAARVDSAISAALADGRIPVAHDARGARIQGQLEVELRQLAAAGNIEAFDRMLAAMPRGVMHAQGNLPPVRTAPTGTRLGALSPRYDNPHLAGALAQMGLTEKSIEQAGPHLRSLASDGVSPPHLSHLFRTRYPA